MFSFIPDEYFLLTLGVVLLVKGGSLFVDSAVSVAKGFNIPEVVIGATVVSVGTTLPEVLTSSIGALSGNGAVAYGNAIGSIICNTALIAALTVSFRPGCIDRTILRFPVCFFFVTMSAYATLAYAFGRFERWSGILLLCGFFIYMTVNLKIAKRNPTLIEKNEIKDIEFRKKENRMALVRNFFVLILSAVVIALGADLLVTNAVWIANSLDIPESVISLTVVALGTSVPELVTAITAITKGHGSLSLGNIIGANILNLLFVSGVSTLINPFTLPQEARLLGINASLAVDIPIVFLSMGILTLPILLRGKSARWQGGLLLTMYALYCFLQFGVLPHFA